MKKLLLLFILVICLGSCSSGRDWSCKKRYVNKENLNFLKQQPSNPTVLVWEGCKKPAKGNLNFPKKNYKSIKINKMAQAKEQFEKEAMEFIDKLVDNQEEAVKAVADKGIKAIFPSLEG